MSANVSGNTPYVVMYTDQNKINRIINAKKRKLGIYWFICLFILYTVTQINNEKYILTAFINFS